MAVQLALEQSYLEHDDPIMQSGFSGGRDRWVAERSPLIVAFSQSGDFLDVGCANGLLTEDVVLWASKTGIGIRPHGIDLGRGLIALARERNAEWQENFTVADAWTWIPDRKWTYVYSLLDYSPESMWCEWLHRLSDWVEPAGRLIIGSYGSRTPPVSPIDVGQVFKSCGLPVGGEAEGGDGPITRFAWTD